VIFNFLKIREDIRHSMCANGAVSVTPVCIEKLHVDKISESFQRKQKMLQKRKKHSEFRFEPLSGRKTFGNFRGTFFVEFCSVPNLGMVYSEKRGLPRKERFFLQNNENHSERILPNIFGTKFLWRPELT
jgi:hypothetical protein